jgi:hypothetical protein
MKRNSTLTLLCVLTFIGSGFSLISNAISGIFYTEVIDAMQKMSTLDIPGYKELANASAEMMIKTGRYYFLLSALLFAVSFYGATMMWQIKKVGFHFYTSAQLLMLFLPMMFKIQAYPSISSLIITLAFVGLYWLGLKKSAEVEPTLGE